MEIRRFNEGGVHDEVGDYVRYEDWVRGQIQIGVLKEEVSDLKKIIIVLGVCCLLFIIAPYV